MNYAAGCYLIAIHMYLAVQRIIQYFLCSKFGNRWFKVYEYAIKTEYQGRGTPHWHMALWVVSYCGDLEQLRGRIKEMEESALFKFLYGCFGCNVDIQIGNGRINYISGYISKDHDAVDVDLGEHTSGAESPWLCTYRLLCKSTPSIGQVAISNMQLPHFSTSYVEVLVFPVSPLVYREQLQQEKLSGSAEMYSRYLLSQQQLTDLQQPVSQSFLVWHRDKKWNARFRRVDVFGQGVKHKNMTNVVACRYWYELADGYLGQFAATQLPHMKVEDLLPKEYQFIPGIIAVCPSSWMFCVALWLSLVLSLCGDRWVPLVSSLSLRPWPFFGIPLLRFRWITLWSHIEIFPVAIQSHLLWYGAFLWNP